MRGCAFPQNANMEKFPEASVSTSQVPRLSPWERSLKSAGGNAAGQEGPALSWRRGTAYSRIQNSRNSTSKRMPVIMSGGWEAHLIGGMRVFVSNSGR